MPPGAKGPGAGAAAARGWSRRLDLGMQDGEVSLVLLGFVVVRLRVAVVIFLPLSAGPSGSEITVRRRRSRLPDPDQVAAGFSAAARAPRATGGVRQHSTRRSPTVPGTLSLLPATVCAALHGAVVSSDPAVGTES